MYIEFMVAFIAWLLCCGFVMKISSFYSPRSISRGCYNCPHYIEVDGIYECHYAENRDIDNEGFYIDELPCERSCD